MTQIIKTHQPCENCNSSDALTIYSDHTYCFSCQSYNSLKKGYNIMPDKSFLSGNCTAIRTRGLTIDTCVKFGYSVANYHGKVVQVATYKRDGTIIGQKIRTKNKDFSWIGSKNPGLYGQHLWKAGGKKVVITEGEIDAMSVSQIQDHKWPVVSLPHGAQSAKKSIKQELEWLESFDEVILMFDQDVPGETAAYECCPLLSPGKVKIAQLPLKDPNEMLVAGKKAELVSAIWNAKEYAPSGIINPYNDDIKNKLLQPVKWGLSYPWPSLTNLTYGIRTCELVTLCAGTGLGKTTVLRQIAHNILKEHNHKIGLLFLEETPEETVRRLVGLDIKLPIHLPDCEFDIETVNDSYESLFGSNNVRLFDSFGSNKFDDIKNRIRFMAISCDIKYIFLDHVTALTSGGNDANERRAIDEIMTGLASLVRELDICLFLISHLSKAEKAHEEGGRVKLSHLRGSNSIAQWSNYTIAVERDQQDEDIEKRHTSVIRILKDRNSGASTGETFKLKFDNATQRMEEITDNIIENDF